jgi:hypothetical protein
LSIPKCKNIPNDHKLYQTTTNYSKLYFCITSGNPDQKYGPMYGLKYRSNRDRCYDVKNIFAKKWRKNWRLWLKTKLNKAKFDHNIGFWEKAPIFLQKIVENGIKLKSYNIDPWSDRKVTKKRSKTKENKFQPI